MKETNYAIENDSIVIEDSDCRLDATIVLDAAEPYIDYSPTSLFTIHILCIIGWSSTVKTHKDLRPMMYGIVLCKRAEQHVYERFGYIQVTGSGEQEAKDMDEWQATFQKRVITIV
jgi:hypothetical protein